MTPPKRKTKPATGTVAPDGKGGWKARITTPDGNRPWVKIPNSAGHTRAWAKEKAAVYSKKSEAGDATYTSKRGDGKPAGATIADIAEAWLELIDNDPKLTPATKAQHRSSVNTVIAPKLGRLKPDELTTATLRKWVRELGEGVTRFGGPPSASIIRNRFNSFSKLIDDAIAEEWITTLPANPCRGKKVRELLPATETPEPDEIVKLTEEQASKLIRSTSSPERRLRYLVEATTGLRDGEVYALLWSSLGAEGDVPVLRVRESLAVKGPEGFGTRKAPKTRASKRTVPLHPLTVEALKAWKAEGWKAFVGRKPTEEDPILPNSAGEASRSFRAAELFRADLEAAGLPKTQHGEQLDTRCLRRSFATWLEAHGVPGDHIDRLMGHSRPSVRGRHYSAPDYAALARGVAAITLDLKGPAGDESGPAGTGETSKESSEKEGPSTQESRKYPESLVSGEVAKWLGNGLQSDFGHLANSGDRNGIAGVSDPITPATTAPKSAISGPETNRGDDSDPCVVGSKISVRGSVVTRLADEVRALLLGGDVDGARALLDVIARLRAKPTP